MGRPPRSDSEIEEFRSRAVIAASALYRSHGAEGMSMRTLATELGCSAMTPYRYFENLEDLVAAVRTAEFRRFADALEAEDRGPTPRARIESIGREYIRLGTTDPHAYRLMFELKPPTTPYPALAEASRASFAPLVRAVSQAIAEGSLSGSPAVIAHVVWAGLHGIVSLVLSDKLNFGTSLDELTSAYFTQVLE